MFSLYLLTRITVLWIVKLVIHVSPNFSVSKNRIPCFSIDNAHLMYNAHPKLFFTFLLMYR